MVRQTKTRACWGSIPDGTYPEVGIDPTRGGGRAKKNDEESPPGQHGHTELEMQTASTWSPENPIPNRRTHHSGKSAGGPADLDHQGDEPIDEGDEGQKLGQNGIGDGTDEGIAGEATDIGAGARLNQDEKSISAFLTPCGAGEGGTMCKSGI